MKVIKERIDEIIRAVYEDGGELNEIWATGGSEEEIMETIRKIEEMKMNGTTLIRIT